MSKSYTNTDACIEIELFVNIRAPNVFCHCLLRSILEVLEMFFKECDVGPKRYGGVAPELG